MADAASASSRTECGVTIIGVVFCSAYLIRSVAAVHANPDRHQDGAAAKA